MDLIDSIKFGVWITAAVFMLILLKPLFLICRERIALYLLLSKCCFGLLFVGERLAMKFVTIGYAMKISNNLMLIIELHVSLLAANRVHAMFWPLSYKKWWMRRRTLLIIWLIMFPCCVSLYQTFLMLTSQYLGFIQGFVPTFVAVIFPCFCYTLLFVRFLKAKFSMPTASTHHGRPNGSVENDGVRMCLVFFTSLMPHLGVLINSELDQYIVPGYLDNSPILEMLVFVNFVAAFSCVEELSLVFLCRDFRILVAKQFLTIFALCDYRQQANTNAVQDLTRSTAHTRRGGTSQRTSTKY